MKIKKYEEVKYVAVKNTLKRDLIITTAISIILAILGIYACIRGMKVAAECEALKRENAELVKASKMKDSVIADYEENLKDLFVENQELKFGGNR